MTGAPTACAVRAAPYTAQEIRPKGLGGAGLPNSGYGYGLAGGPRAFMGPRIQRQWTMAKNTRDTTCNVLPFLLDISLALYDTLNVVKSSFDSEVVFQATLQVPAHHALACRLQAYGTPFAAPDLQATTEALGDEDLEFAACIAAPPDLDEQMSMNIGRVLSMLEENRAQLQQAGPVARAAAHAQQQGAPSVGGTAAQQLRAGNIGAQQQQQQQAPKVLVSVDDAEAGSAQLQRNNSAKKQPKMFSQGLGKRAMESLLGFGYLLTVLHEKHLGGHMQFTASALTAATSATPSTGNSHVRHQSRSLGKTGGGMFAGLRQMVQECPSLSPSSFIIRRSSDGFAAAAAVQQQQQQGSGSSTVPPAPVTPGFLRNSLGTGSSSFEVVWERISSPVPQPLRGAVQGLTLQLSLSAPLGRNASNCMAQVLEDDLEIASGAGRSGCSDGSAAAAAAAAAGDDLPLSKLPDLGCSGSMDRLLDEAIQQLVATESAAAAAAVAELDSVAAAANGGGGGSLLQQTTFNDSKSSPFSKVQQRLHVRAPAANVVRSHYLPDQGCLTSPAPAASKPAAAAATGQQRQQLPSLLNKPPPTTSPVNRYSQAVQQQQQHQVGSTICYSSPRAAGHRPATHSEAAAAAVVPPSTPTQQQQQLPPMSPRILRPMMSMRVTCQPKWQYNESLLEVAGKESPSHAAKMPTQQQESNKGQQQQQQQQQQKRNAVMMHEEGDSNAGNGVVKSPNGLWPTMSFTLMPVRIQPSKQQQQQQQPAYATGRA